MSRGEGERERERESGRGGGGEKIMALQYNFLLVNLITKSSGKKEEVIFTNKYQIL